MHLGKYFFGNSDLLFCLKMDWFKFNSSTSRRYKDGKFSYEYVESLKVHAGSRTTYCVCIEAYIWIII